MEYNYKRGLRKTCSGIGFCVFTICCMYYIIPNAMFLIMNFFGIYKIDKVFDCIIYIVTAITAMVLISLIYCVLSNTPLRDLIPLHKSKEYPIIPIIVVGFALSLVTNQISALLDYNLSLFGITSSSSSDIEATSSFEFVLNIIDTAIIPAIVEEFAFRGVILGKLRKYGDNFAIVVSAVLFGIMHGNLTQAPFAFVIGLILGFAVVKTNTIITSMFIHFLNNLFSVFISIMNSSALFTQLQVSTIYSFCVIIAIAAGLFFSMILSRKKSFFKIDIKDEIIPFKQKIISCFTSVGMIFVVVFTMLEIATTIQIG